MGILNDLIHSDQKLTVFLNSFHSSAIDTVMFWVSYRFTWIPFYLMLCIILYKNFHKKMGYMLVSAALMVTASDQTANFLKSHVQRLRPCHDPEVSSLIHLVGNCGGNFGFVSGHASNSFALAVFVLLIAKNKIRWLGPLMLAWAAIVSYSRVYNGVHFMGDISAGALLGCCYGFIFFTIYTYIEKRNYKNV